ncbi:hypothetical protein [Ralstonia syzygii]|nr:hypothetical protein [Ralstonia syzygii]
MKHSVPIWFSMLFGSCTIAIALSCMAESAPVKPENVESLIHKNKWKEASRAIFLEARSVDKFGWSIPAGQARAGFLEDALDTIADVAPNSQPGALLALVADVPSIPREKKAELVKTALDMARKGSGKSSNYSRSGDLTGVALFYARTGAVSESRVVFEEALRCAESGIGEKGSGAYRRVTETMVRESTGNQDWMIPLVMQHLQRAGKTADSAYSYLDLAQVAVRLQRKELASELVDLGISAAKAIDRAPMRKSALEQLANVAMEAGYTKRLPEPSPSTLAVQEARSGHPEKALAIASGLSETLYVDSGLEAYRRVFDDAVKRGDLETARYFAEHPIKKLASMKIVVWRRVAELQVKKGLQKDAANSYRRATATILDDLGTIRYVTEVEAIAALGESMRQNGFDAEGRKAILEAASMIDQIPERQADGRIQAGILLSKTFWRSGMHADAKQQILRAYRAANTYSDKVGIRKGDLLSEIGQTTSIFISEAGANEPTKTSRKSRL